MPDIDFQFALIGFACITISLVVHEFSHALMADRLGDPTPRELGRLTLNPVVLWKHYPVGSLLVPAIGAVTGFLVGWAAVPVNPALVRRSITLRQAEFLIAGAGPASNVLLAVLSAGVLHAIASPTIVTSPVWLFFTLMVYANLFLAIFNLLPVPPLDGFTVLSAVAPRSWGRGLELIQEYSLLIFALLIFRGGDILGPPIGYFYRLLAP